MSHANLLCCWSQRTNAVWTFVWECKTTYVIAKQASIYHMHTCMYMFVGMLYVLCLKSETNGLITDRRGVTVCTECACWNCFALSMTSDNKFLIFNTFQTKPVTHCASVGGMNLLFSVLKHAMSLQPCVRVSSQLASMCFPVRFFSCV